MTTCLACDVKLASLAYRGRSRKWCSDACREWSRRHPGEKRQSKRSCAACGTDIGHRAGKAKFCSKRCFDVSRGFTRAEPLPDRDCTVCGSSFTPRGVTSKYCSKSCKDRRPRESRKAKPWSEVRRPARTCEVCGETYGATYGKQRTCGRACGVELRRREGTLRPKVSLERKRPKYSGPGLTCRVWFRDCIQCGRAFAAQGGSTKMCSNECRRARTAKVEAEYNSRRPRKNPPCADCGSQVPVGRHKCDDCLRISKKRRKEKERRRRRAVEKGAKREPYTLAEIAARDRNRCGLCRKRVAMTKQVPHPKAPVVDHVLPLAAGGDDTRANVQLAHFICNSLKSAGGSQQLALVG